MKIDDAVRVAKGITCKTAVYKFLIEHSFEVYRKGELVRAIMNAYPLMKKYNIVQAIDTLYKDKQIDRKQIQAWNYYGSKEAILDLTKKLVDGNKVPLNPILMR